MERPTRIARAFTIRFEPLRSRSMNSAAEKRLAQISTNTAITT